MSTVKMSMAGLRAAGATALLLMPVAARAQGRHWVGTWAASAEGGPASDAPSLKSFRNATIRQVVRISMGGDTCRVRLSNEFGTAPLHVDAVRIAISSGGSGVVPGSSHLLTFAGDSAVTIPPGAPMLSDPVVIHLAPLADVAVSLFLADSTGTSTWHELAMATSYVSTGNHTGDAAFRADTTSRSWYFLSGISVRAPGNAGAIVTLGNSITDGYGSTVDANARWPNVLARTLGASHLLGRLAVLDEGISGNRILHDESGPDALSRFDRDVLAQPGVRYVVVMEGINDIGFSMFSDYKSQDVSAAEIIAGQRQLISRAHDAGLRIYGATLTPYQGCNYYSVAGEAKREAINRWIRTSGAYDGVIDFDAVVRDPAHPTRFLPKYDSGDHLHPGDAGYAAMGAAIDLRLFGAPTAH